MNQSSAAVRAEAAMQDAGFALSRYGEPSVTDDGASWRFHYPPKALEQLGRDVTIVVHGLSGEVTILAGQ